MKKFKLTNEFSGKFGIFLRSIQGEIIKLFYGCGFIKCKEKGVNEIERGEKVIVSLTSYGRRVSKILPLTIISLLKQTFKPDKIILWLDDSWKEKPLPRQLKELEKYGLTISYCKDIKSYKKLIPSLELYSDDVIITVDDDVYYRKNVIERLIDCHNSNPGKIICNDAHLPRLTDKGDFLSYNEWDFDISGIDNLFVFPVGVGGCLYKKAYLYRDVCNKTLFMRMAPKADDIWFYFMALLNNTGHIVLTYKENVLIPLDNFYQITHRDSNLSNLNYRESLNDTQINAIVQYYNEKIINIINNYKREYGM